MRRPALLLALVSAALLVLVSSAALRSGESPTSPEAASGKSIIDSYRCGPAEARHVILRGAEDGYSAAGNEPATRHPRLLDLDLDLPNPATQYDSKLTDSTVIDSFEIPPRTASGLIVLKMRAIADNANDYVAIGDFMTIVKGTPRTSHRFHFEAVKSLKANGWSNAGDLYWAPLADLKLEAGGAVIDLVKDAAVPQALDFFVRDDTAVDFAAAVVCTAPAEAKGLTFVASLPIPGHPDIAAFNCHRFRPGEDRCFPFTGDRPCGEMLPLLCFRDLGLPAPVAASNAEFELVTREWSGGEVAATEPVSGDSFASIAEADQFCEGKLGAGWRVAEFHLSGRGWSFAAKNGGRAFFGEYWIDVRGAPHGTCWGRDDG